MKRLISKTASGGFPWTQIDYERTDEGPEGWHNPSAITQTQKGWMDTNFVSSLPGYNNEHTRMVWETHQTPKGEMDYFGKYSRPRWEALKESLQNGYDTEQPISIEVDENGKTSIWEGNHRAWAAKEVGLPQVYVRVEYKGNSQREHMIGV